MTHDEDAHCTLLNNIYTIFDIIFTIFIGFTCMSSTEWKGGLKKTRWINYSIGLLLFSRTLLQSFWGNCYVQFIDIGWMLSQLRFRFRCKNISIVSSYVPGSSHKYQPAFSWTRIDGATFHSKRVSMMRVCVCMCSKDVRCIHSGIVIVWATINASHSVRANRKSIL